MVGGSWSEPDVSRRAFCGLTRVAGRQSWREHAELQCWRPHAKAIRDFKEQLIVVDSAAEERGVALGRP